MPYWGSKYRISKEVCKIISQYRADGQVFIDAMTGGANIVRRMESPAYAYDIVSELIEMYKSLQNGWMPPEKIDKQLYDKAKQGKVYPALTAYIGFWCSFNGKWFAGYIGGRKRDWIRESYRFIEKLVPEISHIYFEHKDYFSLDVKDAVIYLDPPYKNTTMVGNYVDKKYFDHTLFWKKAKQLADNNRVIISELKAPDGFKTIWEKHSKTGVRGGKNNSKVIERVEKLFTIN